MDGLYHHGGRGAWNGAVLYLAARVLALGLGSVWLLRGWLVTTFFLHGVHWGREKSQNLKQGRAMLGAMLHLASARRALLPEKAAPANATLANCRLNIEITC